MRVFKSERFFHSVEVSLLFLATENLVLFEGFYSCSGLLKPDAI